ALPEGRDRDPARKRRHQEDARPGGARRRLLREVSLRRAPARPPPLAREARTAERGAAGTAPDKGGAPAPAPARPRSHGRENALSSSLAMSLLTPLKPVSPTLRVALGISFFVLFVAA